MTLPPRPKAKKGTGRVVLLGGAHIEEYDQEFLGLGPKFAFEPKLTATEKLAMTHSVANQVSEPNRSFCLKQCIDVVSKCSTRFSRDGQSRRLVNSFAASDLRLLVSDKEGSFVVMPAGMFQDKAVQAMQKNFKPVTCKPASVKKKALALLSDLKLERLRSLAKNSKSLELQVFFSAKTHKPDVPFRAIVSERGSWQHVVSGYLQTHLSSLNLVDPFLVRNSLQVVDFLGNQNLWEKKSAFSVDVQDLFYSLPHNFLLLCVKETITELNEETRFVDKCGISVQSFLELLRFYLDSTFVSWQGDLFVQASGVCIGSRVAPVLSDILLSRIDRDLERDFEGWGTRIFRYVDDYLVFLDSVSSLHDKVNILKAFRERGQGLQFTCEVPNEKNELQFLDLTLRFQDAHVCWLYAPRSAKPLLNFKSAHSKLVKNGIVTSCLHAAVAKSCFHATEESFRNQCDRLKTAGFPTAFLVSASERLLKKVNSNAQPTNQPATSQREQKRFAVIPYVHSISHRLKKVGGQYGVDVVFSSGNKLGSLCGKIHRRVKGITRAVDNTCSIKHVKKYTACSTGVVYKIPCSCGSVCIGQTGRCINIRLREHENSLKGGVLSHLASHCRDCGCIPSFEQTAIIDRHHNQRTREIAEAYHMAKSVGICVSQPSVSLSEQEIGFIDRK